MSFEKQIENEKHPSAQGKGGSIDMRRILHLLIAAMALCLLPAVPALAAGTAAGTNITNKASVSFVVDTATVNQDSNEVTLQVAEVLDVTLQWQDSSNILVKAGDTGKAATFLLTNTGNGSEAFTLTVDNGLAGDQFDPTLAGVYLDANDNGQYDAGTDTLYIAGDNDPVLAADDSLALFVVNDIPAEANDSDLGKSGLSAAANTGTGAPGAAFPGAGDGGVNAVVGATGGSADDEATYQISAVDVTVVKSQSVADPYGGSEPMPAAVVTYSIAVTASGSGTAKSVTLADPIPASTTYVDDSLKLEGGDLTDATDGDDGEVAGGTVTVRIGDLQDAAKTVTFQVTID
jgi:uncharacterized repeat protein (TIGR01451 family)